MVAGGDVVLKGPLKPANSDGAPVMGSDRPASNDTSFNGEGSVSESGRENGEDGLSLLPNNARRREALEPADLISVFCGGNSATTALSAAGDGAAVK